MRIAYAGKEAPPRRNPPPSPTPLRDKLIEVSRKWREEQKQKTKVSAEVERLRLARRDQLARTLATTPAWVIIEMVAAWHGFDVDTIVGKAKWADVIQARHDAIAAVYLNCSTAGRRMSLKEIGRAFGGRDHSTILHALRMRGL